MSKKIAIIGGGAAGLAAACSLRQGFDVTVYERGERVGKKILATGNGRCNLANTDLSPSRFKSQNQAEIKTVLSGYSYEAVKTFFEELGLLLRTESEGRVYPLVNQASAVLDVLRLSAVRKGAVIKCDFLVKAITKKDSGFEIVSASGEKACADIVIMATGGTASPKTGSDGKGFDILKALGHSVTPLSPALVPLKSDTDFTMPLKGIRAKAKITLNGRFSESGEIQFTDYGISGIAAMQLSRHLCGRDSVTIDFAEGYSAEYILSLLEKSREKNVPSSELFSGILQRRVAEELIKRVLKCRINAPSRTLGDNDLSILAKAVKGLSLPVTGTLSWDNAQVTSGGVPLGEIDASTMQSKLCDNLYIIGEALDCDGECGGYNLSWAWITAMRASESLNGEYAYD